MKIAYIAQSYPPMISGASLVVEKLATGMAERGHSVLVIAASDKGRAYSTENGRLKIVRLTSVPNPKRANQNFVLWSQKAIEDELKQFSPDVLHIHDILSMGVFGLMTAQRLGTPIISTVHQLPWFVAAYLPKLPGLHETIEFGLWEYSRWLDKQCQIMVVPTRTIAETIQENVGFQPSVITNGVDLEHFGNAELSAERRIILLEKYDLKPDRPILLHVGRLDSDKKVDVVVRAAAKVMEKVNAQLLVVGDGECFGELVNQTKQLGIDEHSHFSGFVSPKRELPDLYRLASAFVTASEIETQGLVLLEALASGLPVVAVNATCIPELVVHGENGFLVPSCDANAMAKGLITIFQNRALAQKMGKTGRSIVQEHSSTTALNKHEALYLELHTQCHEVEEPAFLLKKYQNFFRQLSKFELRGKDQ